MTIHYCNRCKVASNAVNEGVKADVRPETTIADQLGIDDRYNFHLCARCRLDFMHALRTWFRNDKS